MKRSVLVVSLVALLALSFESCVITRPVTKKDYRKTVDPMFSFFTSFIPGLTQLLNGEYIKAGIIAGSFIASYPLMTMIPDSPLAAIPGAILIYQYGDGVYTSFVFADQSLVRFNLSEAELQKVRRREIWIGMPVDLMYVSRGKPDKENKTMTKYGIDIQHVYSNGLYVYSENGVVTAWQN